MIDTSTTAEIPETTTISELTPVEYFPILITASLISPAVLIEGVEVHDND